MPQQIPSGERNQVAHITVGALAGGARFTMSHEDHEAHIESMPVGGLTIVLPGPTAIPPGSQKPPGDNPNDGDKYAWKDALGLITNIAPLTLDGGGFKFGVPGFPTTQTFNVSFQFAGAEYTFNANLKMWIPCGCGPTFINT